MGRRSAKERQMKNIEVYTLARVGRTRLIDIEALRRDLETEWRRALKDGEHLDIIINYLGQGCKIYYAELTEEDEFISDYHWEEAIKGKYDYALLEDMRCEI